MPTYPTGGKHTDIYFLVHESLASTTAQAYDTIRMLNREIEKQNAA